MSDPRLMTRLLAVAVTLTAMAMAAVAAWDRGGKPPAMPGDIQGFDLCGGHILQNQDSATSFCPLA